MKIYSLTSVGRAIASNPTQNTSDALRVLYWMRRKGGQATDDEIKEFAAPPGQGAYIIQKLLNAKVIRVVE